jgi:HK97 family phage major capsid protein
MQFSNPWKLPVVFERMAFRFAPTPANRSKVMTKQELAAKMQKASEQIAAVFAKADEEKRPATAEERETVKRLEAEIAADQTSTRQIEADDEIRAKNAARLASLGQSAGRKTEPARVERTDDSGRVTSFMEATDEEISFRVGESADAQQRRTYKQQRKENGRLLHSMGYKPWGEFKSASDFVRAGFSGHQNTEFRDRHRKHWAAVQGMSEGVGSDGGYTVMPEFSNGIIDRIYSNDLWSRTDNYTVSGNNMTFMANAETSRATGSRHGGLRGYWLGEGSTATKSKPTLREVTLKLVKLGVVVYLTQELIDDTGMALQQYVARKAAEEFQFMIGDSLFNGTGVGQPLGILNAPSLVSVAAEAGQLPDTLETENIVKMHCRFYAPNLPNSVFYHNQDVQPELDTMTIGVGTGGQVTYMPPGGMSAAPYATLRGRPALPTEFNSTIGDQGDIVLADLGQMLSISKGGIAQAVSMHLEFLTDQMALRFIMRLNASPWESAPITPYKGSNTQSSFVTLDAR